MVQEASSLDPADNRARLSDLVPDDTDLVVLPEAFARDFGEAGSDVEPVRRAACPARSRTRSSTSPRSAGRRVVAGHVRDLGRPGPADQHPGRPRRAAPEYRKIHLYDSFGYRESDALSSGPLVPVDGGRPRLPARPDDLLRPPLPRAGPGPRRRGRRGPRRPGRVGGRAAQGRPLAHAGPGAGHREHRVRRRGRAARPAVLRALAGRRPPRATSWPRPRTGPALLPRHPDRVGARAARSTNPSLANRRLHVGRVTSDLLALPTCLEPSPGAAPREATARHGTASNPPSRRPSPAFVEDPAEEPVEEPVEEPDAGPRGGRPRPDGARDPGHGQARITRPGTRGGPRSIWALVVAGGLACLVAALRAGRARLGSTASAPSPW